MTVDLLSKAWHHCWTLWTFRGPYWLLQNHFRPLFGCAQKQSLLPLVIRPFYLSSWLLSSLDSKPRFRLYELDYWWARSRVAVLARAWARSIHTYAGRNTCGTSAFVNSLHKTLHICHPARRSYASVGPKDADLLAGLLSKSTGLCQVRSPRSCVNVSGIRRGGPFDGCRVCSNTVGSWSFSDLKMELRCISYSIFIRT